MLINREGYYKVNYYRNPTTTQLGAIDDCRIDFVSQSEGLC